MSVVVACVEMRVIDHAIDATLCPDLVDLQRLDPEAADEAREVEVADRVAPGVLARVDVGDLIRKVRPDQHLDAVRQPERAERHKRGRSVNIIACVEINH